MYKDAISLPEQTLTRRWPRGCDLAHTDVDVAPLAPQETALLALPEFPFGVVENDENHDPILRRLRV